MEDRMNIRVGGISGVSWQDELSTALDAAGLSNRVTFVATEPPPGSLGSIDPSVVAALVAGGAQVMSALIAILGALLLARRKESKNEDTKTSIVVVIQGSKRTHDVELDLSKFRPTDLGDSAKGYELIPSERKSIMKALEGVGTIREIGVR